MDYGEDHLEIIIQEALEDDLEDPDKVFALFDEYEVANMFAFDTSKGDAARQYILDNGWYEYGNIEDLGIGYMDKYDCEVSIA